ncbi:nucleotidyltransferase domain-containing protein [Chromobacterium amazonense]|uniref:nucleotidyltransferase domain-containing protein n=1 Tax=Chromobacterium amazonense TaxID=1382803 RepID=UPI00237E1C36|nr:nucleotidyltransferase domain-containing protein [Chromobacterium amazonense]MDE1716125.1 nucleotidyltransferase domain-containing protein [Chromobacterium amazonense]
MAQTDALNRILAELARDTRLHTVLLYGSRADGSANLGSDYDIAAFGEVAQLTRDTRRIDGEYLDLFVYPDSALAAPGEEHLKLRGARVLRQRGEEAMRFLAALDAIHAAGPRRLPEDELQARRDWAHKMAARIARGDVEGNYRRAWLLTALLEDYFELRGLWYEGPKKSLRWLKANDELSGLAFDKALRPGAELAAIEALVVRVAGPQASPARGLTS